MEENKGLLLKSAMTYGLAMGIFWVIKYLFFIFSNTVPALNIIYIVLTLTVPFIAYYLTKRYKQDIGGKISFFHAWRFGTMLYFFAALIVALEHFVFFQFIAPADFLASTEVIEAIGKTNFTPIHMAIQGVFNNIFYGIILSIPVAAILCRNNETGAIRQEQ